MDITRLAVDAGAFINRAVQYTEEALGQAEKTELDSRLESLLDRAESTKTWTDKIISQTETLLQPNPGARLEDRLYKGLDWSAPQRPTPQELLSENMINAALELGQHTPYGSTLIKCGELERQIGMANKKLIQSTSINFLSPLRMFTDEECPVIQNERRQLVNKWLDLDIAKSRLRKAQEVENEARGLNADPLGEDYVAHVSYMFSFLRVRWQKVGHTQEHTPSHTPILTAAHLRSLVDFVEAQASYYAQCYQLTQDLRMQLASGPSLGYNNNWPLETNEPSTRNLPIATIQPLAACGSLITNHTTCQSLPTNQANSLSLVTNQASDDSTANETWTAISTSSQAMVTPRAFTSNPVTL
uniref:BAR domain-containing protein n=1 Tax=Esox lucius TaxID=8010 RepID=A0AAY5KSJ4_ESOLU